MERFIHRRAFGMPLWSIVLCGCLGVLVDIDHPISYWIEGKTTRADHVPFGIVSCLVLCGVITLGRRFYREYILTDDNWTLARAIISEIVYWVSIGAIIILGIWLITKWGGSLR